MAVTWQTLAKQQAEAARFLAHAGQERASISRAYYAVYSMVTFHLHKQGLVKAGKQGRENPDHADVASHVRSNLRRLKPNERGQVAQIVDRLYACRVIADYKPREWVDRSMRQNVLRDMTVGLKLLGGGA